MFELLSRPATEVAPRLLGGVVRVGDVAVRLTEVEAYMGEVDPGSHAFRGPSKRNAVMYGPPGHLYTYFTYGMHTCANVVCMPEGVASGILLRAGEVVEGIDVAAERRTKSKKLADLAMGPARLAVALGIRLEDAGTNLESGRVRLELPRSQADYNAGPRTGVSGDGGTDKYPWRFWVPGEPSVSPYRPAVNRKRG